MPRVLITDNLSAAGIETLRAEPGIEVDVRSGLSPEEVREALREADGIIIRSATKLTPEILAGQERLKVIVRAGVGVDNIDLAAATREGIVVMNTPAGNTTSTAEHTIAMLLSLSRNIAPAAQSMHEGKWDRKAFTGTQLAGKTIGVVGLGRIGQSVARRCRGLEMTVLGYDPFISEEKAAEQGIELFRDVDELIARCDYITVHTPLTDETRGLINAERMARMKRGVRIINCARGGIVDEEALADAVEAGQVAGAALDVYVSEPLSEDSRLRRLPQILCTPHLGASTDEAQEQVAVEAAEIITAFLMRNEVRYAVNMAPISAKELEGVKPYIDLGYRLGLLLAQFNRSEAVKSAKLLFRGEAATKPTHLVTNAFTAGLLSSALEENINIINAQMMAHERGIEITESASTEVGDFATMISATVITEDHVRTASGTMFGQQFLRLVRLDHFQLDAYLDGLMLMYRHRDVPGLIGAIGTTFGKHQVNISHMALGRLQNEPGGEAVAVLNLDNKPSDEALQEVAAHPDVMGIRLVELPPAGAPLPWLGL
ncbi:MAG: phosphoglycerate dehydrogenase [Planctomycetota bacterium]|nr:MAG: phosphoglycerate dehydrogenase [Planctomycetota bacterium]REJ89257.1 MAG: phosphoglycerate dehydrogenase [Planctomycetota bacterium]REK29320.1 MAG: phosphoglycerate dehydrogenase [Planctomycetota bacterium]REK35945.1 MAG: phosphoglycerate dehydrogenase [Planctomycetota bacterium]